MRRGSFQPTKAFQGGLDTPSRVLLDYEYLAAALPRRRGQRFCPPILGDEDDGGAVWRQRQGNQVDVVGAQQSERRVAQRQAVEAGDRVDLDETGDAVRIGGDGDEIENSDCGIVDHFGEPGDELLQRLGITYDDDEVLDQVRHDVVLTRRIG